MRMTGSVPSASSTSSFEGKPQADQGLSSRGGPSVSRTLGSDAHRSCQRPRHRHQWGARPQCRRPVLPPDSVDSKTIGNLSMSAISSGTGVVLEDHRIAAKNCLLTTRTAKWATVQFGGRRTNQPR